MSYLGLLVHRATIQKRSTREDRFNQPVDEWTDLATDVRCRLTNPGGSGVSLTDRSQGVVKADYSIYFPKGTGVGEANRIASVVDAAAVLAGHSCFFQAS